MIRIIIILMILITSPFVIGYTLKYENQMDTCDKLSFGQYWYIDGDKCCITSESGWYETDEGSATRFIFGKQKRWRDFECKLME